MWIIVLSFYTSYNFLSSPFSLPSPSLLPQVSLPFLPSHPPFFHLPTPYPLLPQPPSPLLPPRLPPPPPSPPPSQVKPTYFLNWGMMQLAVVIS